MLHPDKNPDQREQSEAAFKKLNLAYETLSDPVKKRMHDQFNGFIKPQQVVRPGGFRRSTSYTV